MGNAGQKLPSGVFWHGFRCAGKRVCHGGEFYGTDTASQTKLQTRFTPQTEGAAPWS